MKKANPITRTVNNNKITRLRITVGVKALFEQKDNGDTVGARVDLSVQVGERVYPVTFDGKHSSQYLRQIVVTDLPKAPFNITVTRVDADSKSQRLQNATLWASYTEVIDTELTYPNTAVVGMMFDSDYFNGLPQRNYEIYGIKVKVPSNYDPIARTYDGLWDGTFKLAWTNNPAWVFYDLMTNARYGMGNRLGEFGVDKWALYAISQYCDVSVPDGFGGNEPRMTCNCWITEQRQAYEVINDLASVFRAMPVWNGQQLTAIQDRPADPVWVYTNANVVEGSFERSFSAGKARHTAIHVEYLDAHDFYERKIEYVADDNLIRRFGLNVKKVTAFGCTSRGQAHRLGKWILETEKLEKETITFKVGREGLMHLPGDIIKVADNQYAGTTIGGRIVSVDGKKVTLDREITINGKSTLSYINADAQSASTDIASVDGAVVTLKSVPKNLQVDNAWSLSTAEVREGLYKAIAISEDEGGIYTITALQHEPQKEKIVDNGAHFEPRSTTLYTGAPQKLSEVAVSVAPDGIVLTWEQPSIVGIVTYEIKLYRDGKLYRTYTDVKDLSLRFEGLPNGHYTAVIRAKNQAGQYSEPTTKSFDIDLTIKNLIAVPQFYAISLSWDLPKTATLGYVTELWASKEHDNFERAQKLVDLAYPQSDYTIGNVELSDTYHIFVRLRDTKGSTGEPVYVTGQSDHNPDNIVTMLEGQITRSQLGQELIAQLQSTDDAIEKETRDRIAALQSESQARIRAIQKESQTRAQEIQREAQARGTAIKRIEDKTDNQAKLIENATARAGEALSGLQAERTARAEGDRANAELVETANTKIQGVESAVDSVRRTIAEKDKATSESITSLESRFDNLSVGGRNLLRNSDFRFGFNAWGRLFPKVRRVEYSNRTIIRVDAASDAQGSAIGVHTSNEHKKMSLIQGETYTLSFKGQATFPRWNYIYLMNDELSRNTRLDTIDASASFRSSYKITFTAPETSDSYYILIGVQGASGSDWFTIYDLKVERGTVATDWSLAPEDIDADFTATSAQITTLERTVSEKDKAQASRVADLSASLDSKERAIKSQITGIESSVSEKDRAQTERVNQLISDINSKDQAVEAQITELANTVSKKDEAQAENYHSLSSRIDNISIGGRNLLRDSVFSEYSIWGGRSEVSVIGERYDRIIKITYPDSDPTGIATPVKYRTTRVVRGREYTLSMRAWSEDGHDILDYVFLMREDGRNQFINPISISSDMDIIRFATFTSDFTSERAFILIGSRNLNGKSINISKVKLELGNKPTDWSPAPEDTDTAITATNAKITTLERTVTEKDQAQASKVSALSASLDSKEKAINAKITAAQKATATLEGKVNSTYTLKTEAIAGGRKAIAGIALGASADNNTAESQVIVMADKFGIVKNKSDGTVTNLMSVQQYEGRSMLAMNGDIITKGVVQGAKFDGGEISIGNGRFNVSKQGHVSIRANPEKNIGLSMNNDRIVVFDEKGNPRVILGKFF
ncbi:phage tail protein [Spirabiliibacterium mucosae]|uniref:phage tail protein n=1 Tax=Spirabiliibacterium mucosae TaxID=28156 RepID=UPI003CFC4297